MDMKLIEEKEDCFILDYNPFDSVDISKLSLTNDAYDVHLSVLAEKGQVFSFVIICCSLRNLQLS